MPGTEWLELLCKHILDRYEHLVRYCGWYSNRSRGARVATAAVSTNAASTVTEAMSEVARRAKAAWARLIRKVYESDPLECLLLAESGHSCAPLLTRDRVSPQGFAAPRGLPLAKYSTRL